MTAHTTTIFMLVLFVLTTGAEADGICTRTARIARDACKSDVTDDYQITAGRCLNTAKLGARLECLAEARDARAEGFKLCAEQFEARIDVCDDLGEAPYDPPGFVPQNFVNPLQIGNAVTPNPFFPLVPGAEWVYEGPGEHVTVNVVGEVKRIRGVPCTVVHDVVREEEGGAIVEDTIDWFAQHLDGTVWYCGELSAEYEDGQISSLDGTWRAGHELARPGVIMPASPQVGDLYRQEFALGEAEDLAEVLSLTGTGMVPAAACGGQCLVTREFTPLEPDVEERKYYAPDIGFILQINPETGERLVLVEYHIP